ncbi:MAG: hypothetical protein QM831_30550 [Kofleriaceae bacterium]
MPDGTQNGDGGDQGSNYGSGGQAYSLTWGPLTVASGVEDTQCIWLQLPNDAPIKVHGLHDVLSTASHHLIVYKDDMDATEQTTPTPCQPFTGALNTSGKIMPLAITQKHDDEILLPDGVAYTLAAHQMIKLEMHYINASDQDAQAQATVNFETADASTIHDEAGLMFTGSPDINIPASGQATLHEFFTVPSTFDLSQSHIFAITGHEHKMGTGVTVKVGTSKDDPAMTTVYNPDPFMWAEPLTQTFDPPFSVATGGGFDFTCSWTNTSTAKIKFGESANDEMCFFWAYYWPAQGAEGSRVCIHTNQYNGANGGYDACCPGDAVCSLIESQF